MVMRKKKICPKCNRKGRGLMGFFDIKKWRSIWVCQLCGAEFTEEMNGDLTYRGQYAIKRKSPQPCPDVSNKGANPSGRGEPI